MRMVSDDHHVVRSSTVQGPCMKKLVLRMFLVLSKECGSFPCLKWSEVVWMDRKQSKNQKVEWVSFSESCNIEWRFYTGFLSGMVASEGLKDELDVLLLASFEEKSGCRILDLLEFVKKTFWRAL